MRHLLAKIRDELIFGGHIMSLGAVSIVYTFALVLSWPIDWKFLAVVYFGVHSVYLFDRYRDLAGDDGTNHRRVSYLKNHRQGMMLTVLVFLFLSFLLLLIYGDLLLSLAGTILFVIGFAYTIFFKRFTRVVVGFKDFFVPTSYISLLILFTYYAGKNITLPALLMLVFVYLRLFIATAFYDLKDIEDDRKRGLLTFAVIWPKPVFYRFLSIVNVLSVLPLVYGVSVGLLPRGSLVLLAIVVYFSYYLEKSRHVSDLSWLSYVYCDGEYLLWLPLILLAHHYFA